MRNKPIEPCARTLVASLSRAKQASLFCGHWMQWRSCSQTI